MATGGIEGNKLENSHNNIQVISVLPSYDGESDSCQHFFGLFSELADLAKWSDQERVTIVKSRLKGNALRYLVDSPKLKNCTFDELRGDFENFFADSQSLTEKHLSFTSLKLLPNEPIRALAHRINTAVSRLMSDMSRSDLQSPVIDRLKLTRFIDALPAEYQLEVLKFAPDGFDKAVELASKIQVALQSTKQLQVNERTLNKVKKPKYLSRSVRIQTVNGSGVRFVSCVELTLKLGGQKLKQVFYVSKDIRGNNLSGIIGCDFIRDNNLSIHLQEQFISLSGLKIPFLGCTERVNTVVVTELPASLVNKQIIGPGETRVLKLRIRQHFVDGTDVLFTPNSKNVHLEIHVAVHKVFCSEFYVIVVNLGCKHMHLNKGMCLGTITPSLA
ncbi:hypothetical protein JTE90_020824 [Oedothorax gibbosus]|uniref:Uncharacterized protein n=1 Tax=Oedothorax gibbosus TaxID=931172 RepID=A0AAV6U7B5_9ARAC|nr:hypothetical protein JTE90_020824 [Oedothorax gibbosus]